MSFAVANDKKIRIFKLRKSFLDKFGSGTGSDDTEHLDNQQDGDGRQDQ